MSFITIHGAGRTVMVPHQRGFAIQPTRTQTAVVALGGNVIRSGSNLHVSSAAPTYAGPVPVAAADDLAAIHEATGTVVLTVADRVYEATWTFAAAGSELVGKTSVTMSFGIVRRLL